MSQSPWSAFQSHRHDIQNFLQLIKAYLQLGKPDRANMAVDECSDWLASLSTLQNVLSEAEEELFWTAVSCPHLRISIRDVRTSLPRNVLCKSLLWLDERTVEQNRKYITVEISVCQQVEESEQGSGRVGEKWCVSVAESVSDNWESALVTSFPADWSALVELVPYVSR